MTASENSPRIEALRRNLELGRRGALDAFWRCVETDGAPLIEPIAGDPHNLLVTFLWRDRHGATNTVRVAGGPAAWYGERTDAMECLLHTDLWYKTFRLRSDFRGSYRLLVNPDVDDPDSASFDELVACVMRAGRLDPLNPAVHVWPANEIDPEWREDHTSVLELPNAAPQPWFAPRTTTLKGRVDEFTVTSNHLENARRIWVYVPMKPDAGTSGLGLMILLDGWMWATALPIAPTLENLTTESKIPPLAVVMVDHVDQTTRSRELSCHEPFLRFLTEELLPLVRKRLRVTDDPRHTIIAGQSLGGLTAAFAGFRLPHVFGNVLSQSGAFRSDDDAGADGEWLTRQFEESLKLPLRFYLDVGLLEPPRFLDSNRGLRDILQAKGYKLTYHEFYGGHDYLCWRGTIADGLIELTTQW